MLPPPAAARIACLIADQVDRHAQPRALPATILLAILAAFLAIAFHAAPPTGFLAIPAVGASGSGEVRTEDPRMRFHSKLGAMAGAVALSVGGQAVAQDAVQWRVKDGGNGHWYQCRFWVGPAIIPTINSWFLANEGAHLATIPSLSEDNFVWSQVNLPSPDHPYRWAILGAYQSPSAPNFSEPAGGWRWVTDEPFDTTRWCAGIPDDVHSPDSALQYPNQQCWNDADTVYVPSNHRYRVIIEWSADCNSDGLVDYGQIRAGELPDANNNNIPDCCEQGVSCSPCPADIARDGVINGIDLAAVLANWGTAGGSINADVNQDGVVNGSDLATVLASWGPCP